ncbi:hypothetical protein [Eggerthella sp. YY7918]|uniref:hypothetical protein n=1 Tax=Eggerthella sp. (strain YY7918) TaxID=502558 RepID=UPI000217113C|nr:hypothetical protein [Eggerthella sp. YY7918]BAK44122.1 hypothetical protein EGYY_09330 [Eggerthella sp. YY7918]
MLAKRLAIGLFDACYLVAAAGMVCFAWTAPAYAYVDPSVMTYTIQALAGVAVALSAVFGVMWRRARKKVLKILNIDENRSKTVENDIKRIDPSQVAQVDEEFVSSFTNQKTKHSSTALPWWKRFLFALCMMAFLMYTYFVIAPFEIVGGNSDSLLFGVHDIWIAMVLFAFVVGTAVALALSALKGKPFAIALGLVFSIALLGFLQALFFNSGLPSADGHAVPWDEHALTMAVNACIWLIVIAACLVFCTKKPGLSRSLFTVLSFALIVTQSIGIATYVKHDIILNDRDPMVSREGLYEVSDKSNVIVFVIDTVDTNQFDAVLAEHPDMLDEFTGFTLFENSAGAMIPTSHAIPFLLSGERLQEDETYNHYIDTRYTRSSFVDDIADQNYSVSLYADCIFSGVNVFGDRTTNIHKSDMLPIDIVGTIKMLSQVALYRDAPWICKPLFWYYTDDISNAVVDASDQVDDRLRPYVLDDAQYYQDLKKTGLSFQEDKSVDGAMKFIHLAGAHVPYTLNEHAQLSDTPTTLEQQTQGTFVILRDYLRELKELGVYDNSTIIVTADHGIWYPTTEIISEPSTPICLVKPATEPGGSSEPYKVSLAPVSQDDFQSTVMEAVGGDKSKYGEGMTYFDVPNTDRVRYYDMTRYPDESLSRFNELDRFKITGDARDFDNWHLTDIKWMRDEE